jgi:hypothetical protein
LVASESHILNQHSQTPIIGRSLKQQLRCHALDLVGIVVGALGGHAGLAPMHSNALQHVIGIAVWMRPKDGSGRNMDYFQFASDLELSVLKMRTASFASLNLMTIVLDCAGLTRERITCSD